MTEVTDEYDVFLSYARVDDKHGDVTRFTEDLRSIFARRAKRQLRVFFDQQDIATSQLWQDRISGALRRSTVLVAMVTDSYLASQWCKNEWDFFASKERGLPDGLDQRRIFPVYLYGEPELRDPPSVVERWMRAIKSRQCRDLENLDNSSEAYHDRVSRLTDDLITSLEESSSGDPGSDASADIELHHMATGYVQDGTRFVRLLSRAVNVTIVGMTNEGLAARLQEALEQKRRRTGNSEAFWGSLRIVFLAEKLLSYLNDGRSEYPDPRYDLTQRELAAGYGRRSIEGFVNRSKSSKWQLFESSHYPPFAGTLFEMPDGSRVVQMIIPRPQRRTRDHLYLEFEDQPDQYFTAAFEDVIHSSSEVNRVVPIGMPLGEGFLCTSTRFFQNVLIDGARETGWMPTVLVVTWSNRNGRAEPLMQLRTEENSTRELDRVSHLAGYVYLETYLEVTGQLALKSAEFDLPSEVTAVSAKKRIRMETRGTTPGDIELVTTRQYLHSDKEHLFFYVYSFELPGHFQFPQRAEMHHLPVEKLLRIRKNQTLRNAIQLCRVYRSPSVLHPIAFEIAALNLTLDGLPDAAERLLDLSMGSVADLDACISELNGLEAATREYQRSGSAEVELKGLSGLQYREFFPMLLPLYAELGMHGAAEFLSDIWGDERRNQALDRLSVLYHDDDVMTAIPIEL